jgi:hypothetical protein
LSRAIWRLIALKPDHAQAYNALGIPCRSHRPPGRSTGLHREGAQTVPEDRSFSTAWAGSNIALAMFRRDCNIWARFPATS